MSNIEGELIKYARELGKDVKVEEVSLVPRVRTVTREQLTVLLPATHHAVLAVWDWQLPDERALIFLGPTQQAEQQRICADLIHQLFPRAILLTERHRMAHFCHTSSFSRLSIEISDNTGDIGWAATDKNARLTLSEGCWKHILPSDFPHRLRTTVENLYNIVGGNENSENKWHHVVDAGRTLREQFGRALLLRRKEIADRLIQSGSGQRQLLNAIKSMTNEDQLYDRRRREYYDDRSNDRSKLELERLLKREEVTLFVDGDTIDDFLCLLQALRCYMGTNRCLRSWLRVVPGSKHQAISVLALGKHVPLERVRSPLDEVVYLSTIYGSYVEPAHEKSAVTVNHVSQDSSSDLPGSIQKWLRDRICTSLDEVCANQLIILAKQLAERHSVHEGRQLHYRFAYAPSAVLWPEIEAVLSFEASVASSNDRTVEQQAKLIEAHWSIFQAERVFGVVDTLMSTHMPRLQRVVRVRPPVRWSGLESEAMDNLAKAAKPCLVVVVLRQWLVRLSFPSKDGTEADNLEWDVREPEPKPQAHTQVLASDLAKLAGIDEERVKKMLATVLSEVSEAAGEGALLVAVGNGKVQEVVKRTCMEMDSPTTQMAWRRRKRLQWMDHTLLRAMLILDGATVIQPDGDREAIIRPRLVVYPVVICKRHPTGFSVISWENKKLPLETGCTCPKVNTDEIQRVQEKLLGKGSRKHGGANIAVLLEQTRGSRNKTLVVSVSADGPIEKWPPKPGQ